VPEILEDAQWAIGPMEPAGQGRKGSRLWCKLGLLIVILNKPFSDADRALVTVVPHTQALRGSIFAMTLLGVLLSCSAPAFNVLGPFKTNKTNAPPSSSVEAYFDGYRQGYSLGYYECGPFTIDYPGPFAEAFIRGQRRGQTNGWEDAEAERRERLRLEQERAATRKLVWHPPLLFPLDGGAADADDVSQVLSSEHWHPHANGSR